MLCDETLGSWEEQREIEWTLMPEDGVVESVCPNGHRSVTIVQQSRFEILSAFAVRAIADCYFRDSVMSFAASLERLYEYVSMVLLVHRGVGFECIDDISRNNHLSERQLGAFFALYASFAKKVPATLSKKSIELRNRVAHRGYLPTVQEAVAFGEDVSRVAAPLISMLKSKDLESARNSVIIWEMDRKRKKFESQDVREAVLSAPTFFSLTIDEPLDVSAAVRGMMKRRAPD
jgi:hypothetical protein